MWGEINGNVEKHNKEGKKQTWADYMDHLAEEKDDKSGCKFRNILINEWVNPKLESKEYENRKR